MRNVPSAMSVFLGKVESEYWETYWPGKPKKEAYGSIQNITFRNIKAEEMGSFGVMLEGRGESKLKNITFENVHIESAGGGEVVAPAAERPGQYPNLIYLYDGNIGTWGLFARHVEGLSLKKVYLWTKDADPRPDLHVEDVQHFGKGGYQPQVKPPATDPVLWTPDRTSGFEVDTQIRAWTIKDEGMDYILDTMQQMCGINNLYMVVVMHQEHRPYQAPEFPHNPARDTWEAEDSRVTFLPDWDRYGEIKPLLSDVDWIRETDWLQVMVDACRKRNMAVGAEVSHYPIPMSQIKSRPDWQQRKLDGSSWSTTRFCPNHPEVRQYVVALFGDLAANYDLDYIQTCQHLFFPCSAVDKDGSCFCPHCIAEAKKIGFDLAAAMERFKVNPVIHFRLDEDVDCWKWRRFASIQLNKGDKITLKAKSDGGEHVRLDFVEFIPVAATQP